MANQDGNIDERLKGSYLAAYQTLLFSKTNKTPDTEKADIERRCLFTKYVTCKNSSNEDVAGSLLQKELENYSSLVDKRSGLNNYWNQFNFLGVNTDNEPMEWKSDLTDPNEALKFLKPLPCSNKATSSCINQQFYDRDVKKMMDLWKNGPSPRARKLPQKEVGNAQSRGMNQEYKEEEHKTFDSKTVKVPVPFQSKHFDPATSLKQNFTTVNKSNFALKNYSCPVKRNEEKPTINRFARFQAGNESNSNSVQKNYSCPIEKNEEKTTVNRFAKFQAGRNDSESTERKVDESNENKFSAFKTARTELSIQQAKNNRQAPQTYRQQTTNNRQMPVRKTLGGKSVTAPYVNPMRSNQTKQEEEEEKVPEITDERLKGIEPKMIELIKNEIMDCGNPISWDDIAGLEHAKRIIKEIVVFPMLRPDIFTGLRRPPKGILLFGPPGTGKTLIGKCIASQSKSTFFSISASSLTSKWIGEGEKMVRALFAVAQVEQPSVVFIDEIDSLLCQRSETEHESSRRMKTEFLVQLDGAATGDEDRILVIGATNRPYELDEAARRRLVKRLYVPLPELEARAQIVRNLLKSERNDLTEENVYEIAKLSDGYSGADMTNLCKEASMGPIRSIPFDQLEGISKDDVRKVTFADFKQALDTVRPSVSPNDLKVYLDWDRTYGTASTQPR